MLTQKHGGIDTRVEGGGMLVKTHGESRVRPETFAPPCIAGTGAPRLCRVVADEDTAVHPRTGTSEVNARRRGHEEQTLPGYDVHHLERKKKTATKRRNENPSPPPSVPSGSKNTCDGMRGRWAKMVAAKPTNDHAPTAAYNSCLSSLTVRDTNSASMATMSPAPGSRSGGRRTT